MSSSLGVDTLNAMIAIALDGANTLAKGADIVKDQRVRGLLANLAAERSKAVARLQQEVRSLGGVPEDRGTVVGSAHRLYTEVKLALAPDDRHAVIDEIQRSEERVKEKFQELLVQDKELPRAVRDVVERQFEAMRRAYDRVSTLSNGGASRAIPRPHDGHARSKPRRERTPRATTAQEMSTMAEQKTKPAQQNEGEGNKTAAREYNKAATQFAESGQVERKADEALKARQGSEGRQLDQAEQVGKSKAKGEDPQIYRELAKSK